MSDLNYEDPFDFGNRSESLGEKVKKLEKKEEKLLQQIKDLESALEQSFMTNQVIKKYSF